MIAAAVFNLPVVSSGVYTDAAGVQHADCYMIGVNTTTCALAVPHDEAHYVVVQSIPSHLDTYQVELLETQPNVYFLDDQFSTPVFSLGLLLRVKFNATIGPVAVVYCYRTGFVRVVYDADVLPAVAGAGDVIKGAGPASQEYFDLMQAAALTLAEPAAALVPIASGSDPASAVVVNCKRLRAADPLPEPEPGRKRPALRSPRTQANAPAATAPGLPPRPGTGLRGRGRPSNKEKAAWAAAGKAAQPPSAAAGGTPLRPGTIEKTACAAEDKAAAGSPSAPAPAPAAAALPPLTSGDSISDSSSSDSDEDVPAPLPPAPAPAPLPPAPAPAPAPAAAAAPLPPARAELPPGLLKAIAALASASQALVAELSPA